jgi:AraC family transcriptional regulator
MSSVPRAELEVRSHHAAVDRPSRTRLLNGAVALAEDVRSRSLSRGTGVEGFSAEFQVVFPYRGMLVWHVGRDDVVGDANQVLFVSGGESYRPSDPLSGGFAELIVTPELDVLARLAHATGADLRTHPLFRRRSRRANPRLQSLRTRFLYWAAGASDIDDLGAEELMLALLRLALADDPPCDQPSASSGRLIRRTKEFLEAEFTNRIRLHQVGRAVGASPEYLTDLFRRAEGVSLHRYVVQLRLARALVELPHADDLSALALDVGFSSHSHFSAAFRRAFGCTPSELRQAMRRGERPALP